MRPVTLTSLLLVTLAAAAPAPAQIEYDFTLIDAFQTTYANRTSIIYDINDNGQAVGWATDLSQVFSTSAFTWSQATDKTRLPDSQIDRAVNNLGDAAGAMLVYSRSTNTLRTIPAVNATYGRMRATGLNDSTIAVGYAEVSAGSNSNGMSQVPFWWEPATGTHAVPVDQAKDLARINNAGLAVGNIRRIPTSPPEAFTYNVHTGQATLLGALLPSQAASRPWSTAADIAENGLIAGNILVFNGTQNAMTAFTWSPAVGFTVQPVLTGEACYFVAQGVNSAGVVVGYTRPPANDVSPNTAVIWDTQHGVRDLNTITNLPAGFILRRAIKINENGWIAAQGYFAAAPNLSRAAVLMPRTVPCNADLGIAGGTPGADGQLDNNDFIAFINYFFNADQHADLGTSGGLPGSDAQFDNNDFIAFITRFFEGC